MLRRTRAPADPVTIYLDDEPLAAERGEPLAVALLGAGKLTLARSPKLHRPRGPSCLRGACDGCLARVDGVPNVMTCLRAARGGERIETQNVVGSREADLLRVTDWFFPRGIDHHHLLAGIPGVSEVMQGFARKLAGLGRLPGGATPEKPARRVEVDVVVVGAGLAGTVVASRLAAEVRSVLVVEDGLAVGGSLAGAPPLATSISERYPLQRATVLTSATAAGVFLGEVLVATEEQALVVRARAKVLATGAHDGTVAVPNNDLPGVLSARALCRLLAAGVAPDGPVAIVGEGFWADELGRGLGPEARRVAVSDLVSIEGSGRARAVVVREGGREAKIKVAAVAVATPCAPAFELAAQAGAAVELDGGSGVERPMAGYRVAAEEHGRAGEHLWAVGECTGAVFDPVAIEAQAERCAADVLAATSG